jgi:hypothetical protein
MRRSFARRDGFLMWTVVGAVIVMGILGFALHFMARQQNAQSHRIYFGEVAQNLAEAGIEHVGRRVRDTLAPHPTVRGGLRLEDGNFFSIFLLDSARLKNMFGSVLRTEDWLRQLLGRDYRYPLDVLATQFPGSSLVVTVDVDPQPLCKDPIVADPVEKRVRFVIRSRADYRGVTRIQETGLEVKVVHPFPPATSKFTLFAHEAEPGQAYNTSRNSTSGLPYTPADAPPLVLNNTPPQEVQDLTLIQENLPYEQTNPFGQMPTVRAALERRGWIYLGTGASNRELRLNMAAGPVLSGGQGFGEFFHLFDPLPYAVGGFDANPAYFRVMQPPAFFTATVPDTLHPPLLQQPSINFLYWGFHYPDGTSNLRDGTLGRSLQTESSSCLHLYGTHAQPSRTKVFGNVIQDYVRFGYLALDRDHTTNDEDAQKANLAASGQPPHVRTRDTIDPVLRYADEPDFQADLNLESSGQPMTVLSTIPPAVVNKNFMISGVIADPGWPTIPLDKSRYTYAQMFGAYEAGGTDPATNKGYSRFMSQVEGVPYNDLLDYMFYGGVIPPQSNPLFREPTLPEGKTYYQLAETAKLTFHDPLHDFLRLNSYFDGALGDVLKPGSTDYAQAVETAPGQRSGPRPPVVSNPSPAAIMLLARTYREFLDAREFMSEYYDAANNILYFDQCVRIRQGDLVLPPSLRYVGTGSIVLMDGSVTSHGVRPLPEPLSGLPSGLTLATLNGDINLEEGIHQAAFIAPNGSIQHSAAAPLLVEGSLAARHVPPSALARGGLLTYDGLYDPCTDLREPRGSAYIDYYQVALSDVPMDWKRTAP